MSTDLTGIQHMLAKNQIGLSITISILLLLLLLLLLLSFSLHTQSNCNSYTDSIKLYTYLPNELTSDGYNIT